MASDILASLISGNAPAAAADPMMLQVMPQMQLAQSMIAQGNQGTPTTKWGAIGRLAQALSGNVMMSRATDEVANLYSGAADAASKSLPDDHPLQKMLKSNSPYMKMIALQALPKAALLASEPRTLSPEQQQFYGTGGRPMAENLNPASPEGKVIRDIGITQGRPFVGNAAGTGPLSQAAGRATVTPEGVPYPSVGVSPPGAPAAPQPAMRPPMATPPAPPPPMLPPAGSPQDRINQGFNAASGMTEQVAAARARIEGEEGAVRDFNEKSTPAYSSAQNLQQRMAIIDHNIEQLGPAWMGAGANTKAQFGNAWNSTLDTFGIKGYHIDPQKIATWQDFNKESVRAGMELIKSNFGGSREAASIIQMGTTAVPSVENTYLGAKYVSATIRAAAQREIDLHEFKADRVLRGQPLVGAEVAFNKLPGKTPDDYAMGAITSQIPAPAVQHLRANPKLAPQFDQQFGPKTAEFILGKPAAVTAPNG